MENEFPRENGSFKYYQQYVDGLETEAHHHDMKAGYLRWLQGHALIRARTASKRKGWGSWSKFLRSIKLPKSTAYACIAIATVILEDKAKTKTWREMLAIAYKTRRDIIAEGEQQNERQSLHGHKQSNALDESPVYSSPKGRQIVSGGKNMRVIQERSAARDVIDRIAHDLKQFQGAKIDAKDREYVARKLAEVAALLKLLLKEAA